MGLSKAFPTLALALFALPAAARIYCCNDDRGRKICGDIVPAQCQSRAYNEFNTQGVLKKTHEAPLTPEQRVQREADLARKKAEEHEAAELARRDKAMMASYSSVADIDAKHNRTVAAARAEIKAAEEGLEGAYARQSKLQKNVERYGNEKKPIPDILKANLRDGQGDIQARQISLEAKRNELVKIENDYVRDRRRYIELTGKKNGAGAAPSSMPGNPPASPPASAATGR
jgi:hypothetical protein